MASLNLADTFVTFLALLGPQKVLLSFARVARTLDVRSLRIVAVATALSAGVVGAAGPPELALASGLVFLIYAVGLVLGIHFEQTDVEPELAGATRGEGPGAEEA